MNVLFWVIFIESARARRWDSMPQASILRGVSNCSVIEANLEGSGGGHQGTFIKIKPRDILHPSGETEVRERVGKKMGKSNSEFLFYRQIPKWMRPWTLDVAPDICQFNGILYLVMDSATSGFRSPRVVDIKLGFLTVSAKDKGHVKKFQGNIRDVEMSISREEGFRVEGLSGRPANIGKADLMKMHPPDFLPLVFQGVNDILRRQHLLALAAQLERLLLESKTWPDQKWVGTSLLITLELNETAASKHMCSPEQALQVRIIDFARSSLRTNATEEASPHVQKYWALWRGGLLRLAHHVRIFMTQSKDNFGQAMFPGFKYFPAVAPYRLASKVHAPIVACDGGHMGTLTADCEFFYVDANFTNVEYEFLPGHAEKSPLRGDSASDHRLAALPDVKDFNEECRKPQRDDGDGRSGTSSHLLSPLAASLVLHRLVTLVTG